MDFHELANIFPMMNNEEYLSLKKSIKENGLQNPVVLYQGKILDGRNRYKACADLGIKPNYKDYDGNDPLTYVVIQNKERRQLTPGQLSFVALNIEEYYAKLAKQNQGKRNDLVDMEENNFSENFQKSEMKPIYAAKKAAEQVGVNVKYVHEAKNIEKEAPDIKEKVVSGEWTMNRAKNEFKRRKKKEKIKEYAEEVKNTLPQLKKYNVIYADPPWDYSTNAIDKHDAVANNIYDTMSIEKIKSFLVDNKISTQNDAVLFLWVTNPFLKKALDVVSAWGFEYKTNIVWIKTQLKKPGVGFYVRGRHELLFICTKGSFTPLDKNISPPIGSVIEYPIGEHSKKPKEMYEIIERLYPGCTYLEIFARNKRDGWDVIGDDSNGQ